MLEIKLIYIWIYRFNMLYVNVWRFSSSIENIKCNVLWEGLGLILETSLAFFLLHETLTNGFQYLEMFLLNIGKIPY